MADTTGVKKKKKLKKRWFVIGGVVLVIAALLIAPRLLGAGAAAAVLRLSDTTPVSRTDLRSTISASGTVESADAMNVYSTLALPVKSVAVEVGDFVHAGDVLAELDGESVENQISTQRASLDTAHAAGGAQLKSAQDSYNTFKQSLDDGLNASLLAAQAQVDSAREAYEKAQTALERYERSLNEGENTQLLSAKSSRNQAQSALESAESALDSAQAARDAVAMTLAQTGNAYATAQEELKALEAGTPEYTAKEAEVAALKADNDAALNAYEAAEAQCSALERQVDSASDAYRLAKSAYDAAETGADDALDDYRDAVDSAKDAYDKAAKNLESTQRAVGGQLESYSNAVQSARAGASTAVTQESIAQLEKQLDDATITAPCDGTVTAVYASVGASGSGLLFVIEDLDDLVIKTTVKGYDIGKVAVGQKVAIRSDATGDAEFDGSVSTIAPTAQKNAYGVTSATGSDALFDTEVTVNSMNTGLRIGLEAQLDYILEETKDVLVVPYDAVYQNDDGQTCVLTVEDLGGGKYTLHEVPVTTGMDDDLDIAVTGDGIAEGVRVVHAPDNYRLLVGQTLTAASQQYEMWAGMMG